MSSTGSSWRLSRLPMRPGDSTGWSGTDGSATRSSPWCCSGCRGASLAARQRAFPAFLLLPRTALQHLKHSLRREPDHQVGHNPAGGWMVLLLLALLLAETLTGLYVANDIADEGPLTEIVPAWAANAIAVLSRDPLGCAAGRHRAACSGDRGVCGDQGAKPVAPDDHGNKGLARERRRAAGRQSGASGLAVAGLRRRHSLPGQSLVSPFSSWEE